jgi:hypothetical protein
VDEAVAFQDLKGLREHFLAHAFDQAAQFTEAVRTLQQRGQDQDTPATGDVFEHRA